jgi:MOB kinase activator 1
VSAPEYVEKLMDWIQGKLDNEEIFPPTTDVAFPRTFQAEIKQIFRRLFRVYAHIYYSHFEKIVSLGEEAHLNTCFKHYFYFVTEFDLVPRKVRVSSASACDLLLQLESVFMKRVFVCERRRERRQREN